MSMFVLQLEWGAILGVRFLNEVNIFFKSLKSIFNEVMFGWFFEPFVLLKHEIYFINFNPKTGVLGGDCPFYSKLYQVRSALPTEHRPIGKERRGGR
jgi:hypothetical protein